MRKPHIAPSHLLSFPKTVGLQKVNPLYKHLLKPNHTLYDSLQRKPMRTRSPFARKQKNRDENVDWKKSENGFPLVKNSLAWLDCKKWNYYLNRFKENGGYKKYYSN